MSYRVEYRETSLNDLKLLKRATPSHYRKALKLIAELYEHPHTGTGHPELLSGDLTGKWSRRISKKHPSVKISGEILRNKEKRIRRKE